MRVERVDKEGKRNLFDCKRGEKPLLEKRLPQSMLADGGRDLSLFSKLVRATTMKKNFVECRNATFYLLISKFSA